MITELILRIHIKYLIKKLFLILYIFDQKILIKHKISDWSKFFIVN